ncbi:hypothetical protein L1987_83932 [Smallanthus sonchifolius]|uniref:Uncharacterized protein n=1 Tax=Smallanthus sonchifolius TaxID=185202 RepID=A0ACB8YDV6_9ASTR|nr:hypothetical protein L1987_83932 [Smallanthus sonchifolius]
MIQYEGWVNPYHCQREDCPHRRMRGETLFSFSRCSVSTRPQTTIPRLLDCFSLSPSSTVRVSAAAPPATGSASRLSQSTATPSDSPDNRHLQFCISPLCSPVMEQTCS